MLTPIRNLGPRRTARFPFAVLRNYIADGIDYMRLRGRVSCASSTETRGRAMSLLWGFGAIGIAQLAFAARLPADAQPSVSVSGYRIEVTADVTGAGLDSVSVANGGPLGSSAIFASFDTIYAVEPVGGPARRLGVVPGASASPIGLAPPVRLFTKSIFPALPHRQPWFKRSSPQATARSASTSLQHRRSATVSTSSSRTARFTFWLRVGRRCSPPLARPQRPSRSLRPRARSVRFSTRSRGLVESFELRRMARREYSLRDSQTRMPRAVSPSPRMDSRCFLRQTARVVCIGSDPRHGA